MIYFLMIIMLFVKLFWIFSVLPKVNRMVYEFAVIFAVSDFLIGAACSSRVEAPVSASVPIVLMDMYVFTARLSCTCDFPDSLFFNWQELILLL